jgi:hypothetical protein
MLKGALVGFGVALLMLLPPIVHFFTGPLGPLVGGFFGGSRVKATLPTAIGVGLLMALFMAAPVGGLVVLGSAFDIPFLPRSVLDALGVVGVVVVVYTGLMGTVGAVIGGRAADKGEDSSDS